MGRARKKLNKISEPNANSASEEAQEKQPRKTPSKSSTDDADESAALPAIAVEIPREDWPSFPQFKEIEENLVLCKDAESKESKSIQCDCKHSSKELKRGKGCGEECLNRLLMMECRGGCPSGKYCTNKRFQRREYAEMELFYTGAKGWGMRAKQDIAQGQFIIEYVGEVIGSREVQRRIRRYGQDPNHKHHYLMALRSGTVIDATVHGNHSRFINHSCDPNAATQKWTVGRQLRIGFFALKLIRAGEEVVFNYQFERYGKRAQKCLCGASNCTGYIGASGREDSGMDSADEEVDDITAAVAETDISSSDSELGETAVDDLSAALQSAKVQPIKRKKGRPPKHIPKFDRKTDKQLQKGNMTLRPERITDPTLREAAEVNEILAKGPLRNREQVLEFNRLMVRVDQTESRRRMVDFLLAIEDPNILRLFVAHQGLALIRIWFVLPPFDLRALQLQSQIAHLLLRLPVTNKNQVDEVCIMSTLNQMINMELPDKLVISEMVNQMVDFVAEEADGPNATAKPNSDPAICEFEELRLLAEQLTDKWANLVTSDFRIPKKLSKTVSKLVTRGMAVLQNNKQNRRFVRRCNSTDECTYKNNGFGPSGDEPSNENDRDWQYRRFRNHFERRIRRRGGQPFFYHQQNGNFNGGRENMSHLGGQLYNDSEYEPPPCFFNAPPRLPKLFSDTLSYTGTPISPSVLPHPNMAHPMASPFYAHLSAMHPNPYCLPPMPSPYHHHLYYAQNGVGGPMMSMPVQAAQAFPPPPPPPPPPERRISEDEAELEMELDNDTDEEDLNANNKPCPSTSSSCNGQIGEIKKEVSTAEEIETNAKEETREKATKTAKDPPRKEKQQKREKQKSAKDLIKESLQRRIQSLKAQLGTKATPPIWGPSDSTDRSASSGIKAERRWSRSRSPSQGSTGSRSRATSITPDSTLKSISHRTSPYKELRKDEEKRGHREEQHDEDREKQYRRRRGEREEEEMTRRRRSGPGEGGRDRSHGHKDQGQSCERRMSVSPDRTGGTDPHIDGRGRRRSSPGRRIGRFAGRPRAAMNNKRFFERRNRGGRWARKMNTDTNIIPRRRGGTYDRIRAQLAEQAYKHQMQDKKEETKLSPAEELQKQQELNSKKAVINAYAEKLKGLIQTDKNHAVPMSKSSLSEHSKPIVSSAAPSEMNTDFKSNDILTPNNESVTSRQVSVRQRSVSTSSTSSASSSASSTSTTSSGSTSTFSSTTSSSSTSTDSQEKKEKEQLTTGRSSPKGVQPPQPIMLKRMIGAKQLQNTQPVLVEQSAQVKKGRFVAAFKIAPSAAHLPIASSGTKSAAVAKAFVSSDGGEDGEGDTLPNGFCIKMEEKPPNQTMPITPGIAGEQTTPKMAECTSKMVEGKVKDECGKAKRTDVIREPKEEERAVRKEKKKTRKGKTEVGEVAVDEKDEDDKLQPPRFSLEILSDPDRMDAYIHQLKEFVYNVETLRRDMHGPPPLPSSMAAVLRQHNNMHSPVSASTSASLLQQRNDTRRELQQIDNSTPSSKTKLAKVEEAKEEKMQNGKEEKSENKKQDEKEQNEKEEQREIKQDEVQEKEETKQNEREEKEQNGREEKEQARQADRLENSNKPRGTPTKTAIAAAATTAVAGSVPTRTAVKRERLEEEEEDVLSPSTSSAQPVMAKRLRSSVSTMDQSTTGDEAAASAAAVTTFTTAPLMSKSGLWLGARDTDGALYFYHRDTREARWDLPEGEELLIVDKTNGVGSLSFVGGAAASASPSAELLGAERQVRRAEFKRHVSALVAKCIDPYRRRFFHANGEYANFLRKITHKVLDNQPKSDNFELLFNEQVQKNTQRLVDEYIRHFKNRESHQLQHHRTDSQGLSPK